MKLNTCLHLMLTLIMGGDLLPLTIHLRDLVLKPRENFNFYALLLTTPAI
jgi:hypothetical protein